MKMQRSAVNIVIWELLVARRNFAIVDEKITNSNDRPVIENNLITREAFIYSFALFISPLLSASDMKFTAPEDIPISTTEISIVAKFTAAENIPKSSTDKALATIRMNKNPQKAEAVFPIKRI